MPVEAFLNPDHNVNHNIIFNTVSNDFDNVTRGNRSIETVTEELTVSNNIHHCTILRQADTIKITHLLFKLHNPEMSLGEFKNELKDSLFTIMMGGSIVYQYELSLLAELEISTKIDDTIVIQLPSYLQKEFLLIAMQYYETRIGIHNLSPALCNSVCLLKELLYLDTTERRLMAQNGHEQHMQLIQTKKITCVDDISTPDHVLTKVSNTNLDFESEIKGYFIESNNLDKLDMVSLSFNNVDKFNYDRNMLSQNSVKVGNNLLYIPFNNARSYEDSTVDSFSGSVNHSTINSVNFRTKFTDVDNDPESPLTFKLHAFTKNILRTMSGMCGLAYAIPRTHVNIPSPPAPVYVPVPTHASNHNHNHNHIPTNPLPPIVILYEKLLEETLCAISLENITDKYGKCTICKNCFDYDAISHWLKSKRSCPMCRGKWTSDVEYRNSDEPNIEPEVESEPNLNPCPEEIDNIDDIADVVEEISFINRISRFVKKSLSITA